MTKPKKKFDCYVVVDTLTGELWANPKGKKTWKRKCDAGNAWTCHNTHYRYGQVRPPNFSDQTRFVSKGAYLTLEVGE